MSEQVHAIQPHQLTLKKIADIIENRKKIELSEAARKKVVECRDYLDKKLSSSEASIYGVNTGFGSLCDTTISADQLTELQHNLVISHACGMGEEVPKEIVEIIILLKVQGLAGGNSAIDLTTLERLVDFFNYEVYPIIFQQGSLGASGDLAPLAHLSLPLIGRGEVHFNGKRTAGIKLEQLFNWKPLKLKSKEGLALLNGTQFMNAYGVYLLLKLDRLIELGELVAAVSMEAFNCRVDFLDDSIHNARPHNGQLTAAKRIKQILEGSEISKREDKAVQDPYSFRCVPQVHGASIDAINHIKKVFEIEINAVTDNPTVFPEEDKIISAGNFHGQPLAINLDYLSIAVAELASIAERRTYKLISGQRDLPAFLIENPGLHSGFMIPQYTAASIVSQNKQLCHPASVDTIDSSNGQEDHVSMGANAATKAFRVVENYEKVMAIELLCAAQAMEFRKPLKSSTRIENFLKEYRKEVPFIREDEELHKIMMKSQEFIRESVNL